jgi:hypothetical protein
MSVSESNYEKLLKEKYYPDPIIFKKEKERIKNALEHEIIYFEDQIGYYHNQATSLRKICIENKQQLKELS